MSWIIFWSNLKSYIEVLIWSKLGLFHPNFTHIHGQTSVKIEKWRHATQVRPYAKRRSNQFGLWRHLQSENFPHVNLAIFLQNMNSGFCKSI